MLTGRMLVATTNGTENQAEEFHQWFRDLLRRRGITQAEAAWMLSTTGRFHPGTIEQWARGKQTPSYRALVSIARAFGELPPELVEPLRAEPDGEATDEDPA